MSAKSISLCASPRRIPQLVPVWYWLFAILQGTYAMWHMRNATTQIATNNTENAHAYAIPASSHTSVHVFADHPDSPGRRDLQLHTAPGRGGPHLAEPGFHRRRRRHP